MITQIHTWSEECEVEDEADQDDPGVGRGTVVVGPDGTVSCLRLVGTSGVKMKKEKARYWVRVNFNHPVLQKPLFK